MEIDPIYLGRKKATQEQLEKVVLVKRNPDRLAQAFIYGDPEVNNFGGITGERDTKYPGGGTPLDGKAGDMVVITLNEDETMQDIHPEDLEDAYVTVVTTIPHPPYARPKAGHKLLKPNEVAQLNGALGWINRDVDAVLGFNPNLGSVRKDALYGAVLTEARRKHSDFLPTSFFRNRKINQRPRVVDGQTIKSLDFFITPDTNELKRMNEIMERCKQDQTRPTVFVPTCPPDEYSLGYEVNPQTGLREYTNTVKYSQRPLTKAISWAAQNALDALSELVPHMEAKGTVPHVVFGLGDYEYYAGYTRGMNREDFMGNTNESAQKIAARMKETYKEMGKDVHIVTLENPNGIHTIQLTHNGTILVTVTGMVEIAGGVDKWNQRVEEARCRVKSATESDEHKGLVSRVKLNRRTMTEHWLKQKRLPFTEENRETEFRNDAGYYVAFHKMVQDVWGENSIVVAGDSRPMELLGARVVGNPLISVSGMYDGASFDK